MPSLMAASQAKEKASGLAYNAQVAAAAAARAQAEKAGQAATAAKAQASVRAIPVQQQQSSGGSVPWTPPAAAIAPSAPLVNTAPVIAAPVYKPNTAINSDLNELKNDYKSRMLQSRAGENVNDPRLTQQYEQYQGRLSADTTKRAIGKAGLSIADSASGQKAAQAEQNAARGITGTGAAGDINSRIGEAAQTRQAKAASDITLGREGQLDALTLGGLGIAGAQSGLNLARAGQTNQLYGGAAGTIGAPAAQNLQERAQGVNEFQAQVGANQGSANQNLAERGLGLQQYNTQAQIDLQRQNQEMQRQQQQEQAYRNALQAVPSYGY